MRVFGRQLPANQNPAVPAQGAQPGAAPEELERAKRQAAEAAAKVTAAEKAREVLEAQVAAVQAERDRVILDGWIATQAQSGRVINTGHFGALVRDRFVVKDGRVMLKDPPKDKPDAKPEDAVTEFLKGDGLYLVQPAVQPGAGAGKYPGGPAGVPPRDLSSNDGLTQYVRGVGGSFLAAPEPPAQ